jgi:hypothetical protein
MPPKRLKTASDPLSDDEKEVLAVAVRLDSAIRYWQENRGAVNEKWYTHCLDDELVRHTYSYAVDHTNYTFIEICGWYLCKVSFRG